MAGQWGWQPGDEFGRYTIVKLLGAGGMGQVYLARNRRLDRDEALKVMYPHWTSDPVFRTRFEREARMAASIDHPNVVAVYDNDDDGSLTWIAMQYVDSHDGRRLIRDHLDGVDPAQAVDIITQAAAGIDAAHARGLLHRDIKPANLLITPGWNGQPGSERVLVADFGIAKAADATTGLTGTGLVVGTRAYLSPEVLNGRTADARADVYALGCTLYELLTGRVAYPQTTPSAIALAQLNEPLPRPSSVRPELPVAFDGVIATALARDPRERYQTCGDLAAAAAATLAAPSRTAVTEAATAALIPTEPPVINGKPTLPAAVEPTAPLTKSADTPPPSAPTQPSPPPQPAWRTPHGAEARRFQSGPTDIPNQRNSLETETAGHQSEPPPQQQASGSSPRAATQRHGRPKFLILAVVVVALIAGAGVYLARHGLSNGAAAAPSLASKMVDASGAVLAVLSDSGQSGGCATASDRGYFCDYVIEYLSNAGLDRDALNRGGYLIKTTLDPAVQTATTTALNAEVDPSLADITGVMSVIAPGQESHRVLAMASSRAYDGKSLDRHVYALAGDGAGNTFDIFTVAAAMEKGLGTSANLDVPSRINVRGMGSGGAAGCPSGYYCVQNAGRYKSPMSVTEALQTSPDTAFVRLIQATGVTPTVDMAVRLGLRSYSTSGTSGQGNQSLADMVKQQNLASFTLGLTAVDPLELSNVAATLASSGVWCPPTPIASIQDSNGKAVTLHEQPCDKAIEKGLADTLTNVLSQDQYQGGTSAGAATAEGWTYPAAGKTGTTHPQRSASFLGFTNSLAAASYVYSDPPGEICSNPIRTCTDGNLFGGEEPALVWYRAIRAVVSNFGTPELPATDPRYVNGSASSQVPIVAGQSTESAKSAIATAGFTSTTEVVPGSAPSGTVLGTSPSGTAVPGSFIVILVSDGSSA